MRRSKIIWSIVLIIASLSLVGYGIWGYNFIKNTNLRSYGPDNNYSRRGMMGGRFGPNNNEQNYSNKEKMSIDQVRNAVGNYIGGYGSNLKISDIFVYKDTDYYVSIEEEDTGKGAMELLVNPYTGDVYQEYGPDRMWNEKYGMHGGRGYGMMGSPRWNRNSGYYQGEYGSKQIDREKAVKTADEYVKGNVDKNFSVLNQGHEFYGYYTFHISSNNKPVGMVSVNYYTGDVWYHNWHGQLDKIISDDEK